MELPFRRILFLVLAIVVGTVITVAAYLQSRSDSEDEVRRVTGPSAEVVAPLGAAIRP